MDTGVLSLEAKGPELVAEHLSSCRSSWLILMPFYLDPGPASLIVLLLSWVNGVILCLCNCATFIVRLLRNMLICLWLGRQSWCVLHLQHIPMLEEFCNMTNKKTKKQKTKKKEKRKEKERKSPKQSWIWGSEINTGNCAVCCVARHVSISQRFPYCVLRNTGVSRDVNRYFLK